MAAKTPPIPPSTVARAILNDKQQPVPQCISHRGYNAAYPENTLVSFRAAIAAGTQAIETDVHLTKDQVVVLSHDATLKRCFGKAEKIIDKDWEAIKSYKTLKKPQTTVPRLLDLLDLLAEPGNEEIWCLLDIKMDNDAETVMRLIGQTLAQHKTAMPWQDRIVLGIWTPKFLPFCPKYLPGYPVMNIGFSLSFSRHFLNIDNVSFNMLFPFLVLPPGRSFLEEARHKRKLQVVSWTVNRKDVMKWCVRNGLDGVITDDPKLYLQVRDEALREPKPWLPLSPVGLFHVLRIWIFISVVAILFRKRIGPVATRSMLDQPT